MARVQNGRTRVIEDQLDLHPSDEARIAELEEALKEERDRSRKFADAYDSATDHNGVGRRPSKGAYILYMIITMALHVWFVDSHYYRNIELYFIGKILFTGTMFALFVNWMGPKPLEWKRIASYPEGACVMGGVWCQLALYDDSLRNVGAPHGKFAWILFAFCSLLLLVGNSKIFQSIVNGIKKIKEDPEGHAKRFFGDMGDE